MLDAQIEHAPYLVSLRKKYPELQSINAVDMQQPFAGLEQTSAALDLAADALNHEEFPQALIRAKAFFSYHWSLIELQQAGEFLQRGGWQTRFAEQTLKHALRWAWQQVGAKQPAVARALESCDQDLPGMFILGMGKLGGRDLNFSSDVDLIAYFDPEVLEVPEVLGKSYICHQVLQALTRLLGQSGNADFIWRVDWRLRPNASATTLAMSTVAAHDYYYYRASPWHRLALMKARVVAGDIDAGEQFIGEITPFIWRQNLDFRALDELGEIKNKINLEHPSLRAERQWREPINSEIGGYNVKLGRGGIREIEFVANALQLVWGGKQYPLREPTTLLALQQLGNLGHLEQATVINLSDAYRFQRRIENVLQIIGNQQTHLIPKTDTSQESILMLLGMDDWAGLVQQLNHHRQLVSQQFEELFAEQAQAVGAAPEWPSTLSDAALEVVEGWDKGFLQYGVSIELRHRLRPLTAALAEQVAGLENASEAIIRLHNFFRSLPQGEQYFRLLAESPALLNSILPPLLYSPPMASLLKQSPHIIDCYMVAQALDLSVGFDSDYVLQATRYEVRLERMRRFVNEQLYQLYLMFINSQLPVVEFQRALTDLAEHTLELALAVVAEHMELAEVPITVVGMGKMGVGKMAPLSDLDLIFVFDPQRTDIEVASKFVARLQTAIATPMREGIVYELDTRLRPSGRSGAPTVSIDSFRSHQLQRAHTWEHIALVSARVVAGDRRLTEQIASIKQEVISQPRSLTQFRKDAAKMWARIAEHRIKPVGAETMLSKLRPGGVMQAEYLAACVVLATTAHSDSMSFDDLVLAAISSSTCGNDFQQLPQRLGFWRMMQLWERLLDWGEQPLADIPQPYLSRILDQAECLDVLGLEELQRVSAIDITNMFEQLLQTPFSNQQELDDWLETKVEWQ